MNEHGSLSNTGGGPAQTSGPYAESASQRARTVDRAVAPPAVLSHGITHLLRRWKLLLGLPLAAAILAAVACLIVPLRYESDITIVPQSQGAGSLGGLASGALGGGIAAIAQGLGLGAGLGGGSPLDYFAALVQARRVADQVLTAPLPAAVDPSLPRARTLLDVFRLKHATLQENIAYGHKAYSKAVHATTDPASGMLTIAVTARTPDLALVIGQLVLNAISDANQDVKDQTARAQVVFIESQTALARHDLESAEDSLRDFYERNRTYQSSPELTFQEGRLHRRVDLAQTVYVGLAQQLEQAKITAAQDIPVFSVVDAPNAPAVRSFPKRTRTVILAAILAGFATAIFLLVEAYYLMPMRDDTLTARRQVREAVSDTLQDIVTTYRHIVRRA